MSPLQLRGDLPVLLFQFRRAVFDGGSNDIDDTALVRDCSLLQILPYLFVGGPLADEGGSVLLDG